MPQLSTIRDADTAVLMFLNRMGKPYGASVVADSLREVTGGLLNITQMGPYDCGHIWLIRFGARDVKRQLLNAKEHRCGGHPAFFVEPLQEHSLHRGRCCGEGVGKDL